MQRHRIWRLPVVRGVVALGESLAIGFRALAISANYATQEESEEGADGRAGRGPDRDLPRPDHLLVRDRDRLRAHALQGRPGADHRLLPIDGTLVRARRGPDPRHDLHRATSSLISLLPDLQARLPVPRGRAQGDQRARGRRRADAGERAEVQLDPSALRNGFSALGHGDRHLRVRVRRAAGLVLADRQPDPAAAGDRRARLRADPLRRQAPGQPGPDDAARARPLAAAADDPRADARPDRGLDPRPPRRSCASSSPRAKASLRREARVEVMA